MDAHNGDTAVVPVAAAAAAAACACAAAHAAAAAAHAAARTHAVCAGVAAIFAKAHEPRLAAVAHYRLWHNGRITGHGVADARGRTPMVELAPAIAGCMFPLTVRVTSSVAHASYIIVREREARRCRGALALFVEHEKLITVQVVP